MRQLITGLILSLLLFGLPASAADEPFWQDQSWTMQALDISRYSYQASGTTAVGNTLELTVDENNCSNGSISLMLATYEKGLSEFKGHPLNVAISVDGKAKALMAATLDSVFSLTPIMDIALITSNETTDALISELKQGSIATFTIDSPNEISEKFDIKSESFSLSGFQATQQRAQDSCEKGKRVQQAIQTANFENFIADLLPLAEQGNAKAQHFLGIAYAEGYGVVKNINEATTWYAQAAESGSEEARYKLGLAYMRGRGVPRNLSYAANLLEIAANRGHVPSQGVLGRSYALGRGVEKSDKTASKWLLKAAEKGFPAAQYDLGNFYRKGRAVPQSDEIAVKWYTKAAINGQADAQNNLAAMYNQGRGVPRNGSAAVKWYKEAAEQGLDSAQVNLGRMYESGKNVTQSNKTALKWYKKAAEQGYAAGQYNLGLMYKHGKGVPQSNEIAAKWLTKAVEQGYAAARDKLKDLEHKISMASIDTLITSDIKEKIVADVSISKEELAGYKSEYNEYYIEEIAPRINSLKQNLNESSIQMLDPDLYVLWTEGLAPSAWGGNEYIYVISTKAGNSRVVASSKLTPEPSRTNAGYKYSVFWTNPNNGCGYNDSVKGILQYSALGASASEFVQVLISYNRYEDVYEIELSTSPVLYAKPICIES